MGNRESNNIKYEIDCLENNKNEPNRTRNNDNSFIRRHHDLLLYLDDRKSLAHNLNFT
jgi:hypothetical protein